MVYAPTLLLTLGTLILLCAGALPAADAGNPAAAGGSGAEGTPSTEEILERVRENTGKLPGRMGFKQDVGLRIAFMSWDFYSEVERSDDGVSVQTHGAPGLIPDELTAELLDVSEAFADFEMTLVEVDRGADAGRPVYVLQGERRNGAEHGARRGTIWVDGERWEATQVQVEYPWGKLLVEQAYQTMNGYTVLARQDAQAAWGLVRARLEITYRDYWFAD